MINLHEVRAEVHGEVKTKYGIAYRVKVFVPEEGFYINGMMVYPPNIDHDYWGVNPPGIPRRKGKFVVEFDKKKPFWKDVEKKCLEVGQLEYSNSPEYSNSKDVVIAPSGDVVLKNIPDGPINLDDIPF